MLFIHFVLCQNNVDPKNPSLFCFHVIFCAITVLIQKRVKCVVETGGRLGGLPMVEIRVRKASVRDPMF